MAQLNIANHPITWAPSRVTWAPINSFLGLKQRLVNSDLLYSARFIFVSNF